MKKTLITILVFILTFVITYVGLCYLVPGLRIKLAAEPMVYFVKSISHMVGFKGMISLVMGVIVSAISVVILKDTH